MQIIIAIALLCASLIHLLPIVGVAGAAKLQTLYGVSVSDPNLELLLRHRAILFALLGGFLAAAVFMPQIRSAAITAGLLSAISFIVLAWPLVDHGQGVFNEQIMRVISADIVAIVSLLVAASLHFYSIYR